MNIKEILTEIEGQYHFVTIINGKKNSHTKIEDKHKKCIYWHEYKLQATSTNIEASHSNVLSHQKQIQNLEDKVHTEKSFKENLIDQFDNSNENMMCTTTTQNN